MTQKKASRNDDDDDDDGDDDDDEDNDDDEEEEEEDDDDDDVYDRNLWFSVYYAVASHRAVTVNDPAEIVPGEVQFVYSGIYPMS